MARKKTKDNRLWDRFDQWEEEWRKKREKERLEDARKIRDAEEDYERTLHSLNPLKTSPDPKKVLASQSREPGLKRLPLESPLDFPLIKPASIIKVEHPTKEEGVIIFRMDEKNRTGDILEAVAFQIKRIIEYVINERLLFFLQPIKQGIFVIRAAGDREAPPIFEISQDSPGVIRIKVLENSLLWSLGYQFNVPEILNRILERFNREIEKQ